MISNSMEVMALEFSDILPESLLLLMRCAIEGLVVAMMFKDQLSGRLLIYHSNGRHTLHLSNITNIPDRTAELHLADSMHDVE